MKRNYEPSSDLYNKLEKSINLQFYSKIMLTMKQATHTHKELVSFDVKHEGLISYLRAVIDRKIYLNELYSVLPSLKH